MRIAELYPYWDAVHDELLDTLARLPADTLNFKPYGGMLSARQMALALLQWEREGIAHLVAGFDVDIVRAQLYPDGPRMAEALRAQREVTALALEPLGHAGLRSVRTVPADAQTNEPEVNRPVGWLFWSLLEREIMTLAQIRGRVEEARAASKQSHG